MAFKMKGFSGFKSNGDPEKPKRGAKLQKELSWHKKNIEKKVGKVVGTGVDIVAGAGFAAMDAVDEVKKGVKKAVKGTAKKVKETAKKASAQHKVNKQARKTKKVAKIQGKLQKKIKRITK